MPYTLKYDPAFKADYRREMRAHPELRAEFRAAVRELAETGAVPEAYSPHALGNQGGNYNGHIDFHLSDGRIDVVVLYLPHKTEPVIRFVRMGPHELFFRGPLR